ncbi:MAG: metal-dependent transcriptional regulator [Chloroflexi bacterium]|nr:metal-dependent transcriptional regulator [Chloroflexota bacterium]
MAKGKKGQKPPVHRLPTGHRLSPVAENYLLSLYVLKEEGVRVSLGQLADYLKQIPATEGLGTSLPSVAGMVHRLVREGLVQVAPDKEIQLTPQGLPLAEAMVRRHRLAERLVVDLLGLELHNAHIEAHRLEHAISPELEARIAERLHNPTTCPFGRPIPGSGYSPSQQEILPLDRARGGQTFVVEKIPEEDQALLKFLVEVGCLPGHLVSLTDVAPYRGIIQMQVDGQPVALGYQVASRIWVRPLDGEKA